MGGQLYLLFLAGQRSPDVAVRDGRGKMTGTGRAGLDRAGAIRQRSCPLLGLGDVGHVLAQRGRRVELVLLLVDQDLADVRGTGPSTVAVSVHRRPPCSLIRSFLHGTAIVRTTYSR